MTTVPCQRAGLLRRWGGALTLLWTLSLPSSFAGPDALRFAATVSATPAPVGINTENWAGYVTASSPDAPLAGQVDDVQGRWTVPAVACVGASDAALGVWVGIDGLSSATVEQVGTATACLQGQAIYYAWSELYPGPATILTLPVRPGDSIAAEVADVGGTQFELTIRDTTADWRFSQRRPSMGRRDSAEWVVEAPSAHGEIMDLADFGAVTFSGATATIAGQERLLGGVGQWTSNVTMVTPSTRQRAVTSPLDALGASFSVRWRGR